MSVFDPSIYNLKHKYSTYTYTLLIFLTLYFSDVKEDQNVNEPNDLIAPPNKSVGIISCKLYVSSSYYYYLFLFYLFVFFLYVIRAMNYIYIYI